MAPPMMRRTRSSKAEIPPLPELRAASESSSKSTLADRSSGYQTPGTSAFATPAETVVVGRVSTAVSREGDQPARTKVDPATRAYELRHSRFALAPPSAKRKWGGSDSEDEAEEIEETPDARLARKLQAQEYAKDSSLGLSTTVSTRSGPRARRSRYIVEDSLSSDGHGSGISVSSSAAFSPTAAMKNLRPSPPPRRVTRSSIARSAKSSARKSIAATAYSGAALQVNESEHETMDPDYIGNDNFETNDSEPDYEPSADEGGESSVAAVSAVSVVPPLPPPPDPIASTRRRTVRQGRATTRQTRQSVQIRQAHLANLAHHAREWTRESRRRLNRAEVERFKLERHHPEVKTMWKTLAKIPVIPTARAPQPPFITRELKPFQLEGLNWMIAQEKTPWKGGLLGDEMGMGKTIQAVSLVMSDYPAKKPTLIIMPPVALMQWQTEIASYTSDRLKVLVYHGVEAKKLSVKQLRNYDVLMISYHTLENVYRKQEKGISRKDKEDDDGESVLVKEDSPFHAIHFHRVILDEAHSIKSRQTATAKACFALKADYKWCLSGTPLQNRIGELFSLLRFLEIRPFACYMCKSCPCTQVEWTLDVDTRQCTECNHRGFDHVSLFNLELLHPISEHGNNGPGKEAFEKLRLLMDRIMLRRVKADHASSMQLPAKDIDIDNQFFGDVERDFASSIMSNTVRQYDTYVAQGVVLNNYANIFGLIMQMRQVADHPDMILKKNATGGQNILVCCICDDPAEDAIRSACHHDFCRACVKSYVRNGLRMATEPDCPRCHIPLAIDLEQEAREQDEQAVKKTSIINRIKMEKWTSSTKIETLVWELKMIRGQKYRLKAIVFSQFTSMLQLVEWRLRRAGFNTVMLDGTMTPTQRQSSIDHFMQNADCQVFLVSLRAGGVALNLTQASKVYIVDPWWNPAAEWQSADRCHRIGQGRPCEIVRLVIEDSVESRMVLLQEKKSNMIRGTINADETAMQNLTPEDMQFLFRGT